MISFSYRNFQRHLNSPLEKSEIQFLTRSFAYSALYFLLFGVFAYLSHLLLYGMFGMKYAMSVACTFLGVILYLPLGFFAVKYRNNPLRVPSTFVTSCFFLLTFCFLFIFLGLTGVVANAFHSKGLSDKTAHLFVGGTILGVFGVTFGIYLIPAIIAMFISKRRTVLSLNKFLNFCYILYIFLFLISVLVTVFGFRVSQTSHVILFIIASLILFLSPILTIYRMKTVAHYINHEDPVERKKWENYFSFEIAFQLLQLAAHIMRFMIMTLSGNRYTRLK